MSPALDQLGYNERKDSGSASENISKITKQIDIWATCGLATFNSFRKRTRVRELAPKPALEVQKARNIVRTYFHIPHKRCGMYEVMKLLLQNIIPKLIYGCKSQQNCQEKKLSKPTNYQ
jgi:hypothetical protein